jgi:hypothetical protein
MKIAKFTLNILILVSILAFAGCRGGNDQQGEKGSAPKEGAGGGAPSQGGAK